MLGKYLFDETLETLEHYQHSEASLDDFLNIPLVDQTLLNSLSRTQHFSKIAVFPVNRRWVDKYSIEFLLFPIRPSVQRRKILGICPRSAEKRRRRLKM